MPLSQTNVVKLGPLAAEFFISLSKQQGQLYMRPSTALDTYRDQIRAIVTAHHATNARVFGSVIRGEDKENSDLDILVEPTPLTSLMDIGAIRLELKTLLGVNVDVVTPNALPDSFRNQILSESIII